VLPRDLALSLHELLRRHFRDVRAVEVIVEQRDEERRAAGDRRCAARELASAEERRRIRAREGRRVADRRATTMAVDAPVLPRRARAHLGRIAFIERIEPSGQALEDVDTARLVAQIQGGDLDAFSTLYMRYFDRVYGYLRLALNDAHEAEDVTQDIFIRVLDALPRYERRAQPFRAWLFVIVRNHALNVLRQSRRLELVAPEELPVAEERWEDERLGEALDWITDRELMMFVERLPLPQRQVLLLRYVLDLGFAEIAVMLGRHSEDARTLHKRAVGMLRSRLTAVGRGQRGGRARMRGCLREAQVLRHRRFALRP
jgi:RNA polymerase sigma-70 factor (ECF subfamily)